MSRATTRSATRSAAEAQPRGVEACLAPLPRDAVVNILGRLSLDERGRASLVSRGWRAALSEPSLWHTLDLRAITTNQRLRVVLAGASARTPCLRTLLLPEAEPHLPSAIRLFYVDIEEHVLEAVVAHPELLRIRCGLAMELEPSELERVVAAAPSLSSLEVHVKLDKLLQTRDLTEATEEHERALRMLRLEPPFGCVKLLGLTMDSSGYSQHWLRFGGISAWIPLWQAEAELTELHIGFADIDATSFGGIVGTAIALQLPTLRFFGCPFVGGGRCFQALIHEGRGARRVNPGCVSCTGDAARAPRRAGAGARSSRVALDQRQALDRRDVAQELGVGPAPDEQVGLVAQHSG